MKKILITGGNGFIGKNLIKGLSSDYLVLSPSRQELDLLNGNQVGQYLKKERADIVIHTANINRIRYHECSEHNQLDGNLRMFYHLESHKDLYERMYYFGSGAEYDMENYLPMMGEEYFGVNIPKDPYGFSKYIMAREAEKENNIYDLRLFGVYGRYEEWKRRFISNAICRVLFEMPITIRKNVYFDYLYVEDLVTIMKWFLENKPNRKHYNICTGKKIDLVTIAGMIKKQMDSDAEIIVAEEGLKPEYSGDNTRFLQEAECVKFTELSMGIENLIKFYKNKKEELDSLNL